MAAGVGACDLVHSHTWYANLAGHLAALLYGIPHVVTSHSLEPSRPWKAEQLGGGYALSSWAERTAYEARRRRDRRQRGVQGRRARGLPDARPGAPARRPQRHRHRRLPTGRRHRRADPSRRRPRPARSCRSSAASRARRACRTCCGRRGSSTRRPRSCCWPERPTRRSWRPRPTLPSPSCAPSRDGVVLVHTALTREEVIQVLSPLDGVRVPVDLRAAGHRQPGGDGVRHGRRGQRRRRHPGGRRRRHDRACSPTTTPHDPAAYEAELAAAVNRLVGDPALATAMGVAGRERAISEFGWDTAAQRTLAVYESVGGASMKLATIRVDGGAAGGADRRRRGDGARRRGRRRTARRPGLAGRWRPPRPARPGPSTVSTTRRSCRGPTRSSASASTTATTSPRWAARHRTSRPSSPSTGRR